MIRPHRPARLLLVLLCCVAAATVGVGCGAANDQPAGHDVRLVLDFTPNAVHAGIYLAVDRGYGSGNGVNLKVEPPGASTDSLKTLLGGQADFAILDIHDLALARQKGADVVGVMPIVQVPLAAVLAQPGVRTPRDLEGQRVGVTGLPSDDAVLDTVVKGAGGDPKKVRRVTIGFNAVSALVGRKVAGATAFWNVEGLEVAQKRPGMREFRVDRYGAPSYPELVVCTTGQYLRDNLPVVQALVTTLQRGYEETISDPASAVSAMTHQVPGLEAGPLTAQLAAVSPSFTVGAPAFGLFNPAHLAAWSKWEAETGIVKTPPVIDQTFWLHAGALKDNQ